MPTVDLIPWSKNPRVITDKAVDAIAGSIRRFGFASPILARRETYEVIAGHGRLLAAHKLGLATVPVRFLDLDEEEAHALALADNKVAELAGWDLAGLEAVLKELSDESVDLDGLGWASSELDAFLSEFQTVNWKELPPPPPAPDPSPDPSPEPSAPLPPSAPSGELSGVSSPEVTRTVFCPGCGERIAV